MKLDFITKQPARILIYSFLLIYILFTSLTIHQIQDQKITLASQERDLITKNEQFSNTIGSYKKLREKQKDYQSQTVDTSTLQDDFSKIKKTIFTKEDYKTAKKLIDICSKDLDELLAQRKLQQQQAEEAARKAAEEAHQAELARQAQAQREEAEKGVLSGTVRAATPINKATITVKSGKVTIASVQSDKDGKFSLKIKQGKYTLVVSASGYNRLCRYNTQITAQQTTNLDITMTPVATNPPPPTPSPAPAPNTNNTPTVSSPQKMRDALNKIRIAAGLAPVVGNDLLDQAALAKVKHMDENNYFAHCQPVTNICDVYFIDQSGFNNLPNLNGRLIGMVLHWGCTTEECAINSWMNSPPHKAILMSPLSSPDYVKIAGFAGYNGIYAGAISSIRK